MGAGECAERGKGHAMDRAGAQLAERRPMLGRAVALMSSESVTGEAAVTLPHEPVAQDLGQDGGCRDGQHESISMRQTVLRQGDVRKAKVVNEQGIRRGLELVQCSFHGLARGRHDADLVDDTSRHDSHAPG